jgi:hypothetical protein
MLVAVSLLLVTLGKVTSARLNYERDARKMKYLARSLDSGLLLEFCSDNSEPVDMFVFVSKIMIRLG